MAKLSSAIPFFFISFLVSITMTEIQRFNYVISIDFGTTFSGSCYSYIGDKKKIVHVVRWPEQSENDTFEKTPTACLYNIENNSPPQLMKWGKAAFNYMITCSDSDPNLLFIKHFKLKLHDLFKQENFLQDYLEYVNKIYFTAAVDYLREIHNYTCEQLLQEYPNATRDQFKYVLTVPANWVDRDSSIMYTIAKEAGIIDKGNNPPEKLVILSEALAASLFCEREYCMAEENINRLYKGQRYIICDAGGGTVDLATYECTTIAEKKKSFSKNDHCQLAMESGGPCGSTTLEKNMSTYLRDEVFFGCLEETVLKNLVDQFTKEIKHYFGGDKPNRNNYLNDSDIHRISSAAESLSLTESNNTVVTTTSSTKMIDVVENDYDYSQDYQNQEDEEEDDSDIFIIDSEGDVDEDMFDSDQDEEMFDSDDDHKEDAKELSTSDYIYFTLPSAGIDPEVIENLSLKGNIITHKNSNIKQLRISHQHIAKYVFNPVIEKVIELIRQQIRNSHTTIDMLFLLGGFGQSPYLYKKLHEEFITNTNSINHLVVPEDGYRASMRGGIYYGLDSINEVPLTKCISKNGNSDPNLILFKSYKFLVGVDFNFSDLTARFSIIKSNEILENAMIFTESGEYKNSIYQLFEFDDERFLNEYHDKHMLSYLQKVFNEDPEEDIKVDNKTDEFVDAVYYNYIVFAFVEQIFEKIQDNFQKNFSECVWNPDVIRYVVSFASELPINQPFDNTCDKSLEKNMPLTGVRKLKRDLMKKLQKYEKEHPSGLNAAVSSHSTFFDEDGNLMKKGTTNDTMWNYTFSAAKRVGIIRCDDGKDRFLKSNQCIYSSFVACKSPSSVKDPRIKIMRKMVGAIRPNPMHRSTCTENSNFIDIVKNDIATFLNLKKYSYTLPTAHVLELEIDGDMDLVGRVTRCEIDKYNVGCEKESLMYETKLNFDKLDKSQHWKKLYDTVIKSLQDKYSSETQKSLSIPTVETLLIVITLETDFMSKHLRRYIKNHVDLQKTQETHSIKDLFIDPSTGHPAKLKALILSNGNTLDLIYQSILNFSQAEITTEDVLKKLIIPWIEFRLAPTIMDTYLDYRSNLTAINEFGTWCIVYSGALIETKSSGSCEMTDDNKDLLLSNILNMELENYFNATGLWDNYLFLIYYDTDRNNTRHMNSLVQALYVQERQMASRVAEKTYAVHFMQYNSSLHENGNEPIQKDFPIIDLQENKLTLYPLIEKNQPLLDWESTPDDRNKRVFSTFYVKSKCYLSAVIYSSEDGSNGEYLISNNAFQKLHRFIIPITNPSKSLNFTYHIKGNSILFTVNQDKFEADFKCYDYMLSISERTTGSYKL